VPDEDHKEIVSSDYANDEVITELRPDLREIIAQAIHEAYRHARQNKVRNRDPSIVKWDKLPDYLKESNREQANHIFEKLHQIGYTVHKVSNRDIVPMIFTEDEIEIMAELEHTRWNVERLRDGWRWGEKRNTIKKTSPYLIGWSELPEDAKELDRQTVRNILELLAKVGLEIQRQV
jgi:DNA invertase Pin-like site-specific DNA recombinase